MALIADGLRQVVPASSAAALTEDWVSGSRGAVDPIKGAWILKQTGKFSVLSRQRHCATTAFDLAMQFLKRGWPWTNPRSSIAVRHLLASPGTEVLSGVAQGEINSALEGDMHNERSSPKPGDLQRFLDAQCNVYQSVCAELAAGQKKSHWMWFIFPQLLGLGHSVTAQRFAIRSLPEARAYLDHPVLGSRLRACTKLVNRLPSLDAEQIFGYPDHLKFRSSMTLFARATKDNGEFHEALTKFWGGEEDPQTTELLGD